MNGLLHKSGRKSILKVCPSKEAILGEETNVPVSPLAKLIQSISIPQLFFLHIILSP